MQVFTDLLFIMSRAAPLCQALKIVLREGLYKMSKASFLPFRGLHYRRENRHTSSADQRLTLKMVIIMHSEMQDFKGDQIF